jgi:hypothetical protein
VNAWRRWAIGGGAGLILVLLATVVGTALATRTLGGLTTAAATLPAPTASPSPTPTATPSPPAFTGDLRRLLLPMPSGFVRSAPIVGSPDGAVTLTQMLDFNSGVFGISEDGVKALGFKQAAATSWTAGPAANVSIVLYQFRDEKAALAWQQVYHSDYEQDQSLGRGDLPGIVNGRYFTWAQPDRGGNYGVAAFFTRNDITAEVWSFTDHRGDNDRLIKLAQQQYARLPG